jgi:hypothetical protein
MPYHQSSAVSVVSVLAVAVTVVVFGYRLGRAHAAWRDVRAARRAVLIHRRNAWRHTAGLAAVTVALFATLFVTAFEISK